MHEFGITEKLFQVALEQANLTDWERIKRLRITLDPDSGYVPDAIQFYFERLAEGTPAEGAILDFHHAPEPRRIALNSLEISDDEPDMVINDTSKVDFVRWLFTVKGVVQGVGFRPFVHGLARQMNLCGWVRNTAAGVEMEIQGAEGDLHHFLHHLRQDAPPLAVILSVETKPLAIQNTDLNQMLPGLEIRPSQDQVGRTLISPDVATCPQCLNELFDPADRQFRYPFTNCTHCGPRFTIIADLPYDRPLTTMVSFPLCPACKAEYQDPGDRRFHAQPVACPDCGPTIRYVTSDQADDQVNIAETALDAAGQCLREGGIIAVKGIGGFHLACRADDALAIQRLRDRKSRPHQPLAMMVRNLQEAHEWCQIKPQEAELLLSRQAPIVLLLKRTDSRYQAQAELLAPQNGYLGLMMPYTPLHQLLLHQVAAPLVMTSGNYHNEPLCIDDKDAREKLAPLADGFLLHNRPIAYRCDDSVISYLDGQVNLPAQSQPIRRSRGLAPLPVMLPAAIATDKTMVVAGADLKNVSAVVEGQQVFLTPHVGNLSHPLARAEQERSLATFERLFKIKPQLAVCDMHPDYASRRYAQQRAANEKLPLIEVQHHHAHIAACLAENDFTGPAIGLSFDGTGYGLDGHIWGGEVFVADLADFQRAYHLEYLPLPGGEAAIMHPGRIAAAYLHRLLPSELIETRLPDLATDKLQTLKMMLNQGLNVPLTSSMGRLFDAVSALLGLCSLVTYEGQAAIALEQSALLSQVDSPPYPFELDQGQIKLTFLFASILADMDAGKSTEDMAHKFHVTVAEMAVATATETQQQHRLSQSPLDTVALSGGVWQNQLLLKLVVPRLQEAGFRVLLHHAVPANDGGLAYGQAAVAAARLAKGESTYNQ